MGQFLSLLWLSLLSLSVFPSSALAADYHEQLNLKPLPLSALLASFNFRANTTVSEFEKGNFRFFPRSLGQILQHAGTRELHLRFSLGRWDAESWGARPWNGAKEGGTGVELWAWLEADTDEEADRKWLTLTNALSGLFCASLNFIDSTRTTRPAMSFQPEGDHSADTNMHLLYGVLPHEVVCTENLTPFLKLLPCKGKAGIASLLDGHKLFDASWQTMAIDVRPICPPGQECVLQIEQTIDMVLDIDRAKRPRDNPIPRSPPGEELPCVTSKPYHSHDTCFPADHTANQDWSLSQLFGKTIKGTCPLTDSTVPPVCLQVPEARSVFVSEGVREKKNPDHVSRCFDIPPSADFDMVLPKPEDPAQSAVVTPETPLLYAERSFTGHGQERGGVQTILRNPSPDSEVGFIYMETLPWFMRIYLHTVEARVAGHSHAASKSNSTSLIQQVYYRPAVDRARGTQLEVRMRVPPASTVFLTYDFEKSILRYTEYPPDANRGFDVAAAVITILNPDQHSDREPDGSAHKSSSGGFSAYNLRTTTLLCSLPTPDFSMPYNVIIFTSTAIALAFGGVFNILVRRFVAADEGPEAGLAVVLGRVRSKVKGLVNKGTRT